MVCSAEIRVVNVHHASIGGGVCTAVQYFFENLEKDTEMDGIYQGVNIKEAASE